MWRSRSDITSIIGASRAADLRVREPDALTTLHGTGAAYGDHAVRTFLTLRDLAGHDSETPAAIRLCARFAQRIAVDQLVEFCEAGYDGPDRVLLCDAVIWLDTLIAEPHAWAVSLAVGGGRS